MMLAVHDATGAIAWKADLGSVINSAPVISGPVLYVGTLKKFFFALDAASGGILMKQEMPGRVKTSPAVARGRVVVATDERLILSFKGVDQ
jgi:outer membrane protein assembly factor BamB